MKRSISCLTLLLTSISAILGSGWLFASYYTAKLAGPSALIAWLIGSAMVIILAFVFAELCAMLPITGSSTRIPQYTHGTLVGFLFSWIIWLAYASLVPTEVQAVIQYLNYFIPGIVYGNGALTSMGYVWATGLVLLISAFNMFSLRWLLHCNNILTGLKIAIPLFISIVVLAYVFTPNHLMHPGGSQFMPCGMHGVLTAIATGGIVFAFNGFKQACEMAGEAKRPSRSLPLAIIGSVLICLVVYLFLQIAALCSINHFNLAGVDWLHLHLPGQNSPISSIVVQDKLSTLLPLLYTGAIVGPMAAALMYAGSASRSLYGMSKNEYIPNVFQQLTRQGNPAFAIMVNFILGMCLFAPLPGWNKMIAFLTSLMAITYAIGPISLLTLRRQCPLQSRPFKLPFATVWATFAFYICTLLTYWSGWHIVSKFGLALLIGLLVLFIHRMFTGKEKKTPLDWKTSIWIWPYFIGLTLLSYIGNFGGGRGILVFGWDFAIIALFCIIIIWLALSFRLPKKRTLMYIRQLDIERRQPDSVVDNLENKSKL